MKSILRTSGALALAIQLFWGAHGFAADRTVKIEFLPPPMQGNVSLGIYNTDGKLVRILAREAEVTDFKSALNGLIAQWDGNDDSGVPCPAGKYHARGYMVGEMDIEGLDYIGNDWITSDDSPHLRRIARIATTSDGKLLLTGSVVGETTPKQFIVEPLTEDAELKPAPTDVKIAESPVTVSGGKVQGASVSGVTAPVAAVAGANGSAWVIDGTTVKEFSAKGELQRTVAADPDDAPPTQLAAFTNSETVFIFGESGSTQQVRALDFTGVAAGGEPKELFDNDILYSDRLEQIAPELTFPGDKPFVPSDVLKVTLIPNPLLKGKTDVVELTVKADAKGSYFALTNGLPVYQISDVPHLLWAVSGRPPGSKVVTVYESDGAVVAGFNASRLANMMAFDAGEFDLPPEGASPTPTISQDGEHPGQIPAETPAPTPTATGSSQ